MAPIVRHPAYVAHDLPPGHRFPMTKFEALARRLADEGLVGPEGFALPEPADLDLLSRVHDRAYVEAVFDGSLQSACVRRIGFPMTPGVALRARAACGGTLLAARLALQHGAACNTAGGSHHADREGGAGFCVFNDVAVAAAALLAEGRVDRVMAIDLDVHQGDGTARIFQDEPRVFTLSIHAARNWPTLKARSDLDVGLDDGAGDEAYLDVLGRVVPEALDRFRPALILYNAGVDTHRDDKLGRLAMSDDGLARRDRFVFEAAAARGIAIAGVLGGGYADDVESLAHRHAYLHRAAAAVFG